MIVLLNGPFGVGKSTVAETLAAESDRWLVFDPEEIGYALKAILGGVNPVEDFQDYAAWRRLTIETAAALAAECPLDILVPMTVWRQQYFDEIVAGFQRVHTEVICICLLASEDTLKGRIALRPDAEASHEWCLHHIPLTLPLFTSGSLGLVVETDSTPSAAVVAQVRELIADPVV